jgi:hypothetical protein
MAKEREEISIKGLMEKLGQLKEQKISYSKGQWMRRMRGAKKKIEKGRTYTVEDKGKEKQR